MKKILDFMQKNCTWIATCLAGIFIVISFALRLMNYNYMKIYSSYYGIMYELIKNDINDYFYEVAFAVILMSCFFSLCHCYKQLYDNFVRKENCRQSITNALIIVVSNIFILRLANIWYSSKIFWISLGALIGFEIIIALLLYKPSKAVDKTFKSIKLYLLSVIKVLPFYLFAVIVVFSANYRFNLYGNKEYRLINDNMAIVAADDDYYIVLDCEINDDNVLTIYKGTQTKIDNLDVSTELHKFDSVEVKDKK